MTEADLLKFISDSDFIFSDGKLFSKTIDGYSVSKYIGKFNSLQEVANYIKLNR